MALMYDSDSGDESDFSGFGPEDIGSDVEIPLLHEESSDDEVDQADDRPINDRWSSDYSAPMIDDFIQQPGPNLPDELDPETATPLDYFWLMFPIRLITALVLYTNRYARWKQAKDGHDKNWVDVTEPEMRAFLGINIVMGVQPMPQIEMYWSTDPYVGNPGIQKTMTCNRFVKINQYFHISDRSEEQQRGQPGYDQLFKVREIMNILLDTFKTGYTLHREVSVDEAMIRYAGRLSFKQYMPAKPIKRGVKVWMLCDANSAYLSNFKFYLGKQNNQTEHGLGFNVVTGITSHIQHTNRWIFFDNFFTGLPLLQSLIESGLYACGTVRINRLGFPTELKKPRDVVSRGHLKVLQLGNSNVTASVWMDKKRVHHLSTLSDPSDIHEATRRVNGNRIPVQQPHSVWSYNKFMGGVDVHDQLRVNYNIGRNGKKWWRYLFWFMLNCAIVNSYIIYKEVSSRTTSKKRYRQVDFRVELQRLLIGGYAKRKRPNTDHVNVHPALLPQENMGVHLNIRLPGGRTTCKYHQRVHKKRRETVYGCGICNIHLCKDGCHALYHAQDNEV